MALEYLRFLAKAGARDIHPGGSIASLALLSELNLEPGQRVLEFGCGAASTLERVCRQYDVNATGLDMLPEMLSRAQQRVEAAGMADRVTLLQGSAREIPFEANAFDAVYCESVLGFQKAPAFNDILRETFRVLRPGGRLIANEGIWKPNLDPELVDSLNAACEKDFGLPQATEASWDVDDWIRELENAGFSVNSYARIEEIEATARATNSEPTGSSLAVLGRELRRAAGWLRPDLIADRMRYRRLISAYRPHSVHIEGRLFVATKPAYDA